MKLLCLLLEMRSGSAVTLFGAIFLDEIAQNQTVVLYSDNISNLLLTSCLLNSCIKSVSLLQTPLIIVKSCHSVYRDLWALRKWSIRERGSEFSLTLYEQDSKARANDTLCHLSSRYKHGTCGNE